MVVTSPIAGSTFTFIRGSCTLSTCREVGYAMRSVDFRYVLLSPPYCLCSIGGVVLTLLVEGPCIENQLELRELPHFWRSTSTTVKLSQGGIL